MHDKGSIGYHYDGDPYYAKLLLFLEDQPEPDGEFICSDHEDLNWAHIKTIIQCINYVEIKALLPNIRIRDIGVFSLMSHMLASTEDYKHQTIYKPEKLKGVIFRGTAVLHKGGRNKKYRRPVFQALLS